MWLFCFEVVEFFFLGGIVLVKVDVFWFLLEKYGYRLINCVYLSEFILVVLENEKDKFKKEFKDVKEVFVIFDGIVRLGEVFVVIVCYV